MFREMRRKDRKLTSQEVEEILANGEYGILTTISPDGYPYGVPLSYVFFNKAIYFHSATKGHKLDNIADNNKVSFTVVAKTEVLQAKFTTKYESVILFGKAVEAPADEKEVALLEIIKKYSPDYVEEGIEYIAESGSAARVIKIELQHVTGKAKK
ncbi:pyridoxamine 5'-phosphate oxidase family protein [Halanaerobium salsuginis]|uniref:Nitroimidazol reductase NimA, pyridoxamine 5'-phosphate oxidase superfamily n=1 Tax=Halanaerobium salsuginis TaxID=29563 RepID=A0A1I4KB09_9FIRM|nr:pyridoxamine 5'-phosphate oxidase family protein [Halanaerobium salsuginis]SFL75791.1 hypothetical protein SAMN02983006_01962 [Halanaerobium salsuginis]